MTVIIATKPLLGEITKIPNVLLCDQDNNAYSLNEKKTIKTDNYKLGITKRNNMLMLLPS